MPTAACTQAEWTDHVTHDSSHHRRRLPSRRGVGWDGCGHPTPGTPPQAPGLYLPFRPWPKARTHHRLAVGGRGTERVLRGGWAARQVAVGCLSTWRAPGLLRQSERRQLVAHVGAPLPLCSPSPHQAVWKSLQTAPPGISTSQGELSISLEVLLGTQAGGWQRYRLCACAHVYRYVFV